MGTRRLRVYRSATYTKPDVPCIMLQGKWLEKRGFKVGDSIYVEEGDGRLVIEHARETEGSQYVVQKGEGSRK